MMKPEAKNQLVKVMQNLFDEAKRQRIGLVVIFKYDTSFEVYSFEDYGFKLQAEKEIKEVLEQFTKEFERYTAIKEAKWFFFLDDYAKVKVKYHSSDDTTTMVDREEIIMFYNF